MLPTEAAAQEALAKHLDEPAEDETVQLAASQGLAMVTKHLGVAASAIPDVIGKLAVVEAGAAVYYRRTARNGIASFGNGEVMPMRISKDPMSTVYPILAPYAAPGISR